MLVAVESVEAVAGAVAIVVPVWLCRYGQRIAVAARRLVCLAPEFLSQ